MSSSASGVLLVTSSGEKFAITFGYGRSFIRPECIVRGFGLKVALNRIDPRQMRSMDTKAYEDLVVAKSTQTSKSADQRTFGVEPMKDILRAVTGEPQEKDLGKRISGADSLVLNIAISLSELPALLEKVLSAYRDDKYLENFDWVDHLSLVADPSLISILDTKVVNSLNNSDTSTTHLAIPDTLEWEDIHAFKIRGAGATEFYDLDLDTYLERQGTPNDLTVELLKSRGVLVSFTRSADDWDQKWTLYHCLVSEQRMGNQLYALIEGRWFSISDALVAEVDRETGNVKASGLHFPSAVLGEVEAAYNKRSSSECGHLLLDAKIIRPQGANSGLEFCDMLGQGKHLIHVKRKSRSSTLSHLFAQGAVSITTLVSDGSFREKIRQIIIDIEGPDEAAQSRWSSLIPSPNENVLSSDYSVSYVVLANSAKPGYDWLPFFSKLSLMLTIRALSPLGVKVTLDRIDVIEMDKALPTS